MLACTPWKRLHTRRQAHHGLVTCSCLTFSSPRRVLEQIKGISEQKASKLLAEGTNATLQPTEKSWHVTHSLFSQQTGANGLHHCHRNALPPKRAYFDYHRIQATRYASSRRH